MCVEAHHLVDVILQSREIHVTILFERVVCWKLPLRPPPGGSWLYLSRGRRWALQERTTSIELFRRRRESSWHQESVPVARIALQPVRRISLQISERSSTKMQHSKSAGLCGLQGVTHFCASSVAFWCPGLLCTLSPCGSCEFAGMVTAVLRWHNIELSSENNLAYIFMLLYPV